MNTTSHGSSGGIDLTDDAMVERLAEEAERGYDIGRLRARSQPGRPALGDAPATVFQVRLEPALREALKQAADASQTTPSEIARQALRAYLQPEREEVGQEGWHASMRQIAALITASRDALSEAGNTYEWQPGRGTVALQELEHAGGGDGSSAALSVARAFMIAAWEGMDVLAELYVRSSPAAFAPYPVARMTVEALSRAHWLYDLDIGTMARTERLLSVLIEAMRSRLNLPGINDAAAREGMEIVKRIADSNGVTLQYKDDLPTKVVGLDMPSKGDLIRWLFKDTDLGAWVYWRLSDVSHANIGSLLGHLEEGRLDVPGLVVDETEFRMLAAAVLAAWWKTTGRLVELMGWRTDHYSSLGRWVQAQVVDMLEPLRQDK